MFRCGFCKNLTVPGEPCTLLVTERRSRNYPPVPVKVKTATGETRDGHGQPGVGFEISKETRACRQCADKHGKFDF